MTSGGGPGNPELGRLVSRWGVDTAAIDGLDAILDGMRGTYARVEALAAKHLETQATEVPWQVERVAGSDPHHAWMYRTTMRQPRAGSGPLAGMRLAVKDSIAVAGVPMTAGGEFLRDFTPSRSALVVDRAVQAGATLVGTAVCEDLCYSGSSFTSTTGPVLNPYDLERAAGGSTSGCGALLATGQADVAFGTDLGGSVRNPAAWCGVCALKPTFGLVPYAGALPTEFSMDHLGLMARTAGDLASLLDAVAGPSESDPRQAGIGSLRGSAAQIEDDISGVRIGVVQDGFGWPDRSDPRLDAVVRDSIKALAELCVGARETSIELYRDARDIHVPISCEGGLATVFEQNLQGSNHAGSYDPELARAFGNAIDGNIDRLPLNGKVSLVAGTVLRHENQEPGPGARAGAAIEAPRPDRRGASPFRCACHADRTDDGAQAAARTAEAGGAPEARLRDARQQLRNEPDRPSRDECAMRNARRAAGRVAADRASSRGPSAAARRASVPAAGFPGAGSRGSAGVNRNRDQGVAR